MDGKQSEDDFEMGGLSSYGKGILTGVGITVGLAGSTMLIIYIYKEVEKNTQASCCEKIKSLCKCFSRLKKCCKGLRAPKSPKLIEMISQET